MTLRAALLATLACTLAAAQPNSFRMTFTGPAPITGPAVTGIPYSAEEITEHTQTLGDGTHIVRKPSSRLMYRDSQGRTRTERSVLMNPDPDPEVKIIEIRDPVAGLVYALNTANKTAHRLKTAPSPDAANGNRVWFSGPKPPATAPVPAPAASPRRPESTGEDLGTQMVEGLLAEGHRSTTTLPVGFDGNDRPLVSTSEVWFSRDLRVMVRSMHRDPRSGESVTRLTNLSRTEPDPALFQIPSGYKIIDEEGPFNIVITRP